LNEKILAIVVILAAFLGVFALMSNPDSVDSMQSELSVSTVRSEAESPEDVAAIRTLLTQFRTAAHAGDVDGIVTLFSDEFETEDASGKDGVRELWTMIIDWGFGAKLKVNIDTAKIEIDGDEGALTVFDQDGDPELKFFVKKYHNSGWLISGAPPEDTTVDYDVYLEPHGDECVQHAGFYRCWDIALPENPSGNPALVIDLHGMGDSASGQRRMSKFETLGASNGFIVAWPMGIGNTWNAGGVCCGAAVSDNIDDVGFLRKMVDEVSRNHAVDITKIYVTGLSNGCAMTQRFAAEASDIVAAGACMSLHLLVPPADDYTPVPMMVLYGTSDSDIFDRPDGNIPTAHENFANWGKINNCRGPAVESEVPVGVWNATYQDCEAESEVAVVALEGAGHLLYKGMQTDVDTTQIAWDFLKRF
jgi:polyhydroxybutyrate depolymerase